MTDKSKLFEKIEALKVGKWLEFQESDYPIVRTFMMIHRQKHPGVEFHTKRTDDINIRRMWRLQ